MAVYFSQVRAVLDAAVAGWQNRTGRQAQLKKHDNGFSWSTKAGLLTSTARGIPLLTHNDIAQQAGASSNLVIALTSGVAGYPRMPRGGPYLRTEDIQLIIDWINGGALEDPPVGNK